MDPRDFADLFQQATYQPPDDADWAALMQVADRYGAPIGGGLDMPRPEPEQPQGRGSMWMDRLALALASTPPPPRVRGFLPNLAVGAARGFTTGRLREMSERERAQQAAAAANERALRSTFDWRRAWLDRQRDAAAEHRKERAAALKVGAGSDRMVTIPTAQGPRLVPASSKAARASGVVKGFEPPKPRVRQAPTPRARTPEDDRVDAAERAGLTFAQFARQLASMPNDSLAVMGLSRARLLTAAGRRLKR